MGKHEKAPGAGGQEMHLPDQTTQVYGPQASQATTLCSVVAATLAACELDKLKALERLPTPELLTERLQNRATDFFLLVGVVAAFLKNQGADRG